MSVVMFAMSCDHCKKRSEEYSVFPSCIGCGEDVCPACYVDGSHDEETGHAYCRRCAVADAWARTLAGLRGVMKWAAAVFLVWLLLTGLLIEDNGDYLRRARDWTPGAAARNAR